MLVGCYITGEQTGRSPHPTLSHPIPSTLDDRDTRRAGSYPAPKDKRFQDVQTEGPDGRTSRQLSSQCRPESRVAPPGRSGMRVKKTPLPLRNK